MFERSQGFMCHVGVELPNGAKDGHSLPLRRRRRGLVRVSLLYGQCMSFSPPTPGTEHSSELTPEV